MRELLREARVDWLYFSWRHPMLVVVCALGPLFVACSVATLILPQWAVFGIWMYGSAAVIGRVRPVRRLLRMRRYRAWARRQHSGATGVYTALCVCLDCDYVRRTEPWHTELFDQAVERGDIKLKVVRLHGRSCGCEACLENYADRIQSRLICGNCAAGQGGNCKEHS